MNRLVCEQCGGTNVQVLAWVDANTNEFKSDYGSSDKGNWCEDCQDIVYLYSETVKENNGKQ
jgi:hypothetical protein